MSDHENKVYFLLTSLKKHDHIFIFSRALLRLPGVTRVFYGNDYVTVTKTDDDTLDWMELKAEVLATITDFLASGLPIIEEGAEQTSSTTGEINTQFSTNPAYL